MATLKQITVKKSKDGGKNYYLGNLRVASYRSYWLTKDYKFAGHIHFPSPVNSKENWSDIIKAQTIEEVESAIKVILDKIVSELSEPETE